MNKRRVYNFFANALVKTYIYVDGVALPLAIDGLPFAVAFELHLIYPAEILASCIDNLETRIGRTLYMEDLVGIEKMKLKADIVKSLLGLGYIFRQQRH